MQATIGTIGGIIGILVFLGAAASYLRGSKDKGTITTLEANNVALSDRVKILENELSRMEISIRASNDRISALERENTALLQVRPSAEVIAEIKADLASHDARTLAAINTLKGSV